MLWAGMAVVMFGDKGGRKVEWVQVAKKRLRIFWCLGNEVLGTHPAYNDYVTEAGKFLPVSGPTSPPKIRE